MFLKFKSLWRMLATTDNRFEKLERLRLKQLRCRANMRGVPTKGQGLYEAHHGSHGFPFQSLPEHIRDSYEAHAAGGASGYVFRGNNSAYRKMIFG
jgi:hypothetical protein